MNLSFYKSGNKYGQTPKNYKGLGMNQVEETGRSQSMYKDA